jgi:hypothetical protein
MTAYNLISQALRREQKDLPPLPYESIEAVCCVSGERTRCLKRKDVLGKTFTNGDVLKAPDSQYAGVDVFYAWYYGYYANAGKKREKRPERMSSWFCDGETFEELDRQGVRDKVLSELMPDVWAGYATTSYKKHGSLLAPVNSGQKRVWLFEEQRVDCSDYDKMMDWWDVLNEALRSGFGRSILESLECPPYLISKIGVKAWIAFEQWARDKWQSSLYAFLCYLLPSQEELKNETPND